MDAKSLIVEEKELQVNTIVATWNPQPDYYDAFSTEFECLEKITVDDCFKAFIQSTPSWVNSMMKLRGAIVKHLGLKADMSGIDVETQLKNYTGKVGDALAFFKIYERDKNEILSGEDDKHLDFRLSIQLQEIASNKYLLRLTTSVKMNAFLGHLYFVPVKPFHRLIVPICVRSIVKQLTEIER